MCPYKAVLISGYFGIIPSVINKTLSVPTIAWNGEDINFDPSFEYIFVITQNCGNVEDNNEFLTWAMDQLYYLCRKYVQETNKTLHIMIFQQRGCYVQKPVWIDNVCSALTDFNFESSPYFVACTLGRYINIQTDITEMFQMTIQKREQGKTQRTIYKAALLEEINILERTCDDYRMKYYDNDTYLEATMDALERKRVELAQLITQELRPSG